VVSFGSDFEFLFVDPRKVSQEAVEDTVARIESFAADMGGTEIYSTLAACLKAPGLESYPRTVFLLTDGNVSDSPAIISFARQQCANEKYRLFVVGIGNGVSQQFVKGLARAGGGSFELITDEATLEDKIILLLKSSFAPSLTGLKLTFDPQAISAITPNFSPLDRVTPLKPIKIFVLFHSNHNSNSRVTLDYFDPIARSHKTIHFDIDTSPDAAADSYVFHKMAVDAFLKEVDVGRTETQLSVQQQAMLAVDFQVLCSKTAFICVIKDARLHGSNHATSNVIFRHISKSNRKRIRKNSCL